MPRKRKKKPITIEPTPEPIVEEVPQPEPTVTEEPKANILDEAPPLPSWTASAKEWEEFREKELAWRNSLKSS